MKTCLLDVNVLLAIAWPHHTHHGIVHQWWQASGPAKWATSTQTQLGFVRVSCNPKFSATPATPGHALQLLQQMTSRPDHEFWGEVPEGIAESEAAKRLTDCLSHAQITDAYLAALACYHGGDVATLDRSLAARQPDVAVLVSS
jgi:uncharacterized protein